jgi:hypothetical protein
VFYSTFVLDLKWIKWESNEVRQGGGETQAITMCSEAAMGFLVSGPCQKAGLMNSSFWLRSVEHDLGSSETRNTYQDKAS